MPTKYVVEVRTPKGWEIMGTDNNGFDTLRDGLEFFLSLDVDDGVRLTATPSHLLLRDLLAAGHSVCRDAAATAAAESDAADVARNGGAWSDGIQRRAS